MQVKRVLTTVLALMLVMSICAGPAIPAMEELPYGILYGDVDEKLLGLEVVVDYESFKLVRGYVDPEQVKPEHITYQPLPDHTVIYLRSGSVDSSLPLPDVPADLSKVIDDLHLVQFIGPIKTEWLDAASAWGQIVDYIPNFTLIMHLDSHAIANLLKLDFVTWIGPYLPAYRIAPEVLTGEVHTATVKFYDRTELTDGLVKDLQIVHDMKDSIIVSGDTKTLRQAALVPGVAFVEPFMEPQLFNNETRNIIRSYHPHNRGVIAENQIGAVTDTGVYWGHESFSQMGKIPAYLDFVGDAWQPGSGGDGHGHGTHCAGSMLGDAPPYGSYNGYDGQGLGAKLIPVKVFNNAGWWGLNTDYYTMWQTPHCLGARVNSNSWGMYSWGNYLEVDQVADQICWDHRDYVLAIASANGGNTGPGYLGSPGVAKNAITVGATERTQPENVASFSSRGPTADQRIKPDVMAPGVSIWSSQRGTVSGYTTMSGTSMATPQVAGAALLVRDYFMRGFYPTGVARVDHEFEPSAALVKAVLINGAVEMTGLRSDRNNEGVWPNNAQGWGRINLQRSLYFRWDSRMVKVWENPVELSTGQMWTVPYYIPLCATDVKFTLVWTDYPGSLGTGVTLRNDLNLRVTSPDGYVYLGNNFNGLNPGHSIPGGYPDVRNTVEGVHLVRNYSHMPAGQWTIEVFAANVPDGPQNFALVVSNHRGPCYIHDLPIAVLRDSHGILGDLLVEQGFVAWSYDNERDLLADLDTISVIIVNEANNDDDFAVLIEEARVRNKGLVFLSQEPGPRMSGLEALSRTEGDPELIRDQTWETRLSGTVRGMHPITAPFEDGDNVDLFQGEYGVYQLFEKYSGDIIMSINEVTQGIIGVGDFSASEQGRHVLLAGFGVCAGVGTEYWTPEAVQIFVNAVDWARDHLK